MYKTMTLTNALILAIFIVLVWIGYTLFISSMKPKETGYFPNTPSFPCRNTPYKNQTPTHVDEIIYGYREPYHTCEEFPRNPELPLP
jgi:hypothetical protein